ncbi:SagB/ThcOx family dehydrogenase [Nocardiopsis mangrovi]|uniref:SagB/ThcOx family dehydrogenase n=1 Tax=Nocardiopsis mangrovi TaxID=1179818 RepID=A0ABV9DZJ5_9ACTN
MRTRRARCLAVYWASDHFLLDRILAQRTLRVNTATVTTLARFTSWVEYDDAVEKMASRQDIAFLLEHGLLLEEGTKEAELDERVHHHWRHWNPQATAFHFSSKNANYVESTTELKQAIVGEGRPPLAKAYPDADRVLLPRLPNPIGDGFLDTLYGRRTHRSFSDAPVPRNTFAALMAAVFGPKDFIAAGEFGSLMIRTSPAGGARNELEAYVAVFNVEDIDNGVYHYNVLEHSLELLHEGQTREEFSDLCHSQSGIGEAGFAVVLTAVLERMTSKYRSPRAYRVMLLNAGHLGQSFALTSTALGLGPFQTLAFKDTEVEARLGIDPATETSVYVLSAGVPDPGAGEEQRLHSGPARLDSFRMTPLLDRHGADRDVDASN